jgi:sialic acid synthase SpsE
MEEIEEAVRIFERRSKQNILMFHCVAEYPAAIEHVNARFIVTLRERFPYPVGFSDHTLGIEAAVAAVALGANMIEKHFTLDNSLAGGDHSFSANPKVMKAMVQSIREVEKALGSATKELTDQERQLRKTARRTIVANTPIAKGSRITKEMLTVKRPAETPGLEPRYLASLEGRIAQKNLQADEAITWDAVVGGEHG